MPGPSPTTVFRSIFTNPITTPSKMSSQIHEGIFAINKPPAISSAQVIRDVQKHFGPSALFRSWIDRERSRREAEAHNQKRKRKWRGNRINEVKMGHGGTLDPMATGVLILGVGQGTKDLAWFMTGCKKSYEATVLFGVGTDTYDTEGKVLSRKEFGHITREMVEEKLKRSKGKGVQRPPVFSALRVQGKRLYEYAREGKEVPVEIKERPVEVSELEMVEWFEGGTHEWQWPETEASEEEKGFAEKLLRKAEEGKADAAGLKRERVEEDVGGGGESQPPSAKRVKAEEETVAEPEPTSSEGPATPRKPCPAPACRIRMTVTSGFYVRSLCQELGEAVGSAACMSALVRTSQGGFELGENVLWYDELKQGEEVWGPKVKAMLLASQARTKTESDVPKVKRENAKKDAEAESKKEADSVATKPAARNGAEASEKTPLPKETKTEGQAIKAAPPADSKWKSGY